MENYILCKGEIEGRYREVNIYPMQKVPNSYPIQWDGFEIGTIKKVDDQWITDTEQLMSVVDKLGEFIDTNDDI